MFCIFLSSYQILIPTDHQAIHIYSRMKRLPTPHHTNIRPTIAHTKLLSFNRFCQHKQNVILIYLSTTPHSLKPIAQYNPFRKRFFAFLVSPVRHLTGVVTSSLPQSLSYTLSPLQNISSNPSFIFTDRTYHQFFTTIPIHPTLSITYQYLSKNKTFRPVSTLSLMPEHYTAHPPDTLYFVCVVLHNNQNHNQKQHPFSKNYVQ